MVAIIEGLIGDWFQVKYESDFIHGTVVPIGLTTRARCESAISAKSIYFLIFMFCILSPFRSFCIFRRVPCGLSIEQSRIFCHYQYITLSPRFSAQSARIGCLRHSILYEHVQKFFSSLRRIGSLRPCCLFGTGQLRCQQLGEHV